MVGENFLHPTKVAPPSFAGQIKRALIIIKIHVQIEKKTGRELNPGLLSDRQVS